MTPENFKQKVYDYTGRKCWKANCSGKYEETTQNDDLDGVLHCTGCNQRIPRYRPSAYWVKEKLKLGSLFPLEGWKIATFDGVGIYPITVGHGGPPRIYPPVSWRESDFKIIEKTLNGQTKSVDLGWNV